MTAIAARLEQQYPADNTDQGVVVTPLLESMVRDSRPALLLLSGAVGFVLLVACANVANLLLARGTGRLRELALRAAIGADRARLVRQMLTESAALSLVGAVGGLLLAYWATRTLTVLASAGVPRAEQISIDLPVLVFTLTCALLTSVAFGLMPAVHLSRQDLHESLRRVAVSSDLESAAAPASCSLSPRSHCPSCS
jgi:putative ABC transport system permease protein